MFENKKEKSNRTNPFFENYNTPHETVPFSLIEISDYEEAFMEGIRRDDEEIEKIINDESEPTFENTIIRTDNEKGEHYYDLLNRPMCFPACSVPKPMTSLMLWHRK